MLEPQKLDLVYEEQPNHQQVCIVKTISGMHTIHPGTYRLVYGVPRKLWPVPNPKGGIVLVENYEYELKTVMDDEFLQKVKDDYQNLGWGCREAIEIRGQFDSSQACWMDGARIFFATSKRGTTVEKKVAQWRFSLYKGDALYDMNHRLIIRC